MVLGWLWDRHDEVCERIGTASHRPEWVVMALAPCASCFLKSGECNFIAEQRALTPATQVKCAIENLSGDSEDWSGEGTSEMMSSCDDQPRRRCRVKTAPARSHRPQAPSGQKALPMAVTTPIVGHPTSRAPLPLPGRAGLHKVLVVGDANAQELGALHDLVDATLLAKPGASWQNIGKDIEACMSKEHPGTWKHKFHMVLTILGSNDVPKSRARNQTWEKAQGSIKAALARLQECLIVGELASHVFVSAPFNLDPLLSSTRFIQTLQEAADEAGASFIPIKWLPTHGDIEATHKRLNVAGKQLLVDSFLRASQPPKPVSGPSCTPPLPLPPPSVTPSKRSPTQVGSSSSGSQSDNISNSSSSSNSSCSKQSRGHRGEPSDGKNRAPAGHEAQTGLAVTDLGMSQAPACGTPRKVCEICNTKGHHDSANCPLVWACSTGQSSDIELVEQAMCKLDKIMSSPWDRSVVVVKTDISQVITMPSDGNCLFAALVVGAKTNLGTPLPSLPERRAIGKKGRDKYLALVKKLVVDKAVVLGVPIDALLTDLGWSSVEEYLVGMEPPIASRRQWGGFVEAAILGHVWQMQVAFFLELHGGDVAMMTEPVGTGAKGRICLWWRGTHYDLLVLSDAIWSRCCAQRAGHRSRDPLVRPSAHRGSPVLGVSSAPPACLGRG